MTDDGNRTSQHASGSYNAQAQGHSTAIVNVFQAAPAAEVDPARLAEAERRLAALPLDDLPDPGALPAGSAMAWRRNRRFVGRERDLRTLAEVLKQGGASAVGQSPTVIGWGGVGKTQLAAEVAYRYGPYFAGGVFWLNFAEPAAIPAEIARCGGPQALHLHPPRGQSVSQRPTGQSRPSGTTPPSP